MPGPRAPCHQEAHERRRNQQPMKHNENQESGVQFVVAVYIRVKAK